MLVFPKLTDIAQQFPNVDPRLIGHDLAYPAMLTVLPVGWMGLMVAGLLAAYVSTISTHLNWGTSYLIHDLYRRFVRPDASERHYVMMGRLITGLLMLLAAWFTYALDTASEAFGLLLSVGAGTGLLYLLRWFWWRINAWSEIVAMIVSFAVATTFFVLQKRGMAIESTTVLLSTVAITSVAWIAATLFTTPTDRSVLIGFYRQVRPSGPGWRDIRREAAVSAKPDSLANAALGWVLGCVFVYAALFGTGSLLYGRTGTGLFWVFWFIVSGVWLLKLVPSMWAGETDRMA
jgi:Na+/proline symporter